MTSETDSDQAGGGGRTTRRSVLTGLAAGALVVGFSPFSRRWVTAAEAADTPFDALPPIEGTILFDTATRQADSHDEGNIVQQLPYAVLRPASAADIATMIKYCRPRGIKVAARGQAHTTFGQGLTNGLLIENRSLSQVYSITPSGVEVGAGALWTELLKDTLAQGLTPPVFTDYTDLSVAGTLSVGGVSTLTAHGLQIDHVQELEVVTGAGDIVRCSMKSNRDLFEAMLGGLGQCGIITRVRMDVVPAPSLVRMYLLHYTDNATFFSDLRTLLKRGELDGLGNRWIPGPDGASLVYEMVGSVFYEPSAPPDDATLLRGLQVPPAAVVTVDLPYLEFVLRVNPVIDTLKTAVNWDSLVKPWFDVWVSNQAVEGYVAEVLSQLRPEDVGVGGFLLLAVQRRSKITRPFFRQPAPDGSDFIFLFDVLTANPPDPDLTTRLLARNRRLFERARSLGGTRYPIGAIEFSHADWAQHYGEVWPEFQLRKRQFDPDNILTPGPGIF